MKQECSHLFGLEENPGMKAAFTSENSEGIYD
jgi:hypothetical protein